MRPHARAWRRRPTRPTVVPPASRSPGSTELAGVDWVGEALAPPRRRRPRRPRVGWIACASVGVERSCGCHRGGPRTAVSTVVARGARRRARPRAGYGPARSASSRSWPTQWKALPFPHTPTADPPRRPGAGRHGGAAARVDDLDERELGTTDGAVSCRARSVPLELRQGGVELTRFPFRSAIALQYDRLVTRK
jgi:hypothetical protein